MPCIHGKHVHTFIIMMAYRPSCIIGLVDRTYSTDRVFTMTVLLEYIVMTALLEYLNLIPFEQPF